jgi:hypothetical protein
MNCLDFRRELNIHPHADAADFVAHARACPRCAQAQADAIAFESSLGRALEIAVPAQLADAILLAQATAQSRQRRGWRRTGGWLALAAAAVLAVGVGWPWRPQPLGTLAVVHMLGQEAPALALTQPVGAEAVRKAFAERGVVLAADVPADISYVQCCPVGEFKSVHMVMPRASGPVTVMYLVDDPGGARTDFAHAGWLGRSVPMAHGTLVMIGHDASQFAQIEQQWQRALRSGPTLASI